MPLKLPRLPITLLGLFLLGLGALPRLHAEPDAARLLARIEPDGTVSAGAKAAVRAAVEAGRKIRIGWSLDFNHDGKADLVHWADAPFLSVLGDEVYAQIAPIREQGGVRKDGKAVLHLGEKARHWHALLGTNGILEGAFDDDSPKQILPVRSWWCLADGEPGKEIQRQP